MTTLLQADGTWNATPTHVGDGTWAVVASAPDPAGNVGSAAQNLVIGLEAAPPVTPTPTPEPTPTQTPTPPSQAPVVAGSPPAPDSTSPRAAALKTCQKKKAKPRKECRKRARKLPI